MSAEFIACARARGLVIDNAIADGKLHRVAIEGRAKTDKSGWYVLSAPTGGRMFGSYGNWADGRDADKWVDGQGAKPLTKSEQVAIAEMRKNATRQRETEQQNAAKAASEKFEQLPDNGDSPYLKRKGVGAYGVRFDGSAICVPQRDENNVLWSFQRIAPDGEKRSFPGGRTGGCFHLIGIIQDGAPLLICEGYATAATLHEATGAAVAAAMSCHNLGPVATTLKRLHPKARMIVCADDDAKTERTSGVNPGVQAAKEVAKRLKCEWIKPQGLPDGASDFNDLAIDEVKAQLAKVLDQANASGARRDTLPRFDVNGEGVWYFGQDREGKPLPPSWICSRLVVSARTRDGENVEWGYLLEFDDPEGRAHAWAMPARMLSGDGNEYRQQLLSQGLRINTASRSRELLTQYIQSRNPEELARCTDRSGWHGSVFLLPNRTIGESEERIIYQTGGATANPFRERGTLDEWKSNIGMPCIGNSRLVFSVSLALAGPTLHLMGLESGGIHLRGGSSSGKTTALIVAGSVYGAHDFMQSWRHTDNALESTAAQRSDTFLPLDEIAQVDPKVVGDCAYLLSNGTGKARQGRTGMPRAVVTWRLLFLSAGEIGLSDHMAEGNKQARPGQELRFADIAADAGRGMGMFEELHSIESPAKFAQTLKSRAGKFYGVAGPQFIERLAADQQGARQQLKALAATRLHDLAEKKLEGQAMRVAVRFAYIGAAGELATSHGLTGWPEGEAMQAAMKCFNAWLRGRGGSGDAEERAMLMQVRGFLERHGDSRFTHYSRAEKADDHMPDTIQRAGFKRFSGEEIDAAYEFYVLPDVFKREVCKGFDHKEVAHAMKRRGFLKTDDGRLTLQHRLPTMGKTRCFLVLPSLFEFDQDADSDRAAID